MKQDHVLIYKVLASASESGIFFFFLMGQSGNGKCNILSGWPKVPYHDYSISLSLDY